LATWHDYHYYFGHVMWDIEAFAVPALCLLQPHAARALLDYRSTMLAGAERNARLMGRRGLQFPWESAPSSGEEAAPLPGTASWHEDHVSLDVARAFALYADVTGDRRFLRDRAWPVLRRRLRVDHQPGDQDPRRLRDQGVDGHRRARQPVDNAAFTNMAAVVVLREGLRIAEDLGWIPTRYGARSPRDGDPDARQGVVSHDDYRVNEEKGATPDPLDGDLPLRLSAWTPRRSRRPWRSIWLWPRTISAVRCCRRSTAPGRRGPATGDLPQAAGRGLRAVHGRALHRRRSEYRPDRFPEQPQAGPFFANIGGFLTSLLFGFTGLRAGPGAADDWSERPVVLPGGWTAIEVDRLWVRAVGQAPI
jgi:hypothetical protein